MRRTALAQGTSAGGYGIRPRTCLEQGRPAHKECAEFSPCGRKQNAGAHSICAGFALLKAHVRGRIWDPPADVCLEQGRPAHIECARGVFAPADAGRKRRGAFYAPDGCSAHVRGRIWDPPADVCLEQGRPAHIECALRFAFGRRAKRRGAFYAAPDGCSRHVRGRIWDPPADVCLEQGRPAHKECGVFALRTKTKRKLAFYMRRTALLKAHVRGRIWDPPADVCLEQGRPAHKECVFACGRKQNAGAHSICAGRRWPCSRHVRGRIPYPPADVP